MSEATVQCCQFQSVFRCQIRQIMIRHLIGSAGMTIESGQIVWDSSRFALRREYDQRGPGSVHGQTNGGFAVCADPQEAKFNDRAEDDLLALEPSEGGRMLRMGSNDAGTQQIDVEQMLHGKSARSSLMACSLIGWLGTTTV